MAQNREKSQRVCNWESEEHSGIVQGIQGHGKSDQLTPPRGSPEVLYLYLTLYHCLDDCFPFSRTCLYQAQSERGVGKVLQNFFKLYPTCCCCVRGRNATNEWTKVGANKWTTATCVVTRTPEPKKNNNSQRVFSSFISFFYLLFFFGKKVFRALPLQVTFSQKLWAVSIL